LNWLQTGAGRPAYIASDVVIGQTRIPPRELIHMHVTALLITLLVRGYGTVQYYILLNSSVLLMVVIVLKN
jgi:hypothetical protein